MIVEMEQMKCPLQCVGLFSNVRKARIMLVGFGEITDATSHLFHCPTIDIVTLCGTLSMDKMKTIVHNGFVSKEMSNVEERDNVSRKARDVMENSIVQMEKMNSIVLSIPNNDGLNKENGTRRVKCFVSLSSISKILSLSSSLSSSDEDRRWSCRLCGWTRWTECLRLSRWTNVGREISLWSTDEVSSLFVDLWWNWRLSRSQWWRDLFVESNEMSSRNICLCRRQRMSTESMWSEQLVWRQFEFILVFESESVTHLEVSINERSNRCFQIRKILF